MPLYRFVRTCKQGLHPGICLTHRHFRRHRQAGEKTWIIALLNNKVVKLVCSLINLLFSQIHKLLHFEATQLKLEVTTLLDTNAVILADAYLNRTGTVGM
jgi:hypothetical protein